MKNLERKSKSRALDIIRDVAFEYYPAKEPKPPKPAKKAKELRVPIEKQIFKTYRQQATPEQYFDHLESGKERARIYQRAKRIKKEYSLSSIRSLLVLRKQDPKQFLYRLAELGILTDLREYMCPKCKGNIELVVYSRVNDGYIWRCRNYRCRLRFSLRTYSNLIFHIHNKVSITGMIKFIFTDWWRMHCNEEINLNTGFTEATVCSIKKNMRALIAHNRAQEVYKFGDNGIVEIDELVLKRWFTPDQSAIVRINKAKDNEDYYNVEISRFKRHLWIFGITERGIDPITKIRVHFEIMNANPTYDNPRDTGRNAAEVDRILQDRLQDNCVLMSDQHSMYQKLQERMALLGLNIEHNTINKRREKYIVTRKGKPNLKIYTQSVENKWRLFRKIYRKMNRVTTEQLENSLDEIAWRVENIDESFDSIVQLLKAIPTNLEKRV